MKKIVVISIFLFVVSTFAFSQEEAVVAQEEAVVTQEEAIVIPVETVATPAEVKFSNTLYTGYGNGSVLTPPVQGVTEPSFEGVVDYFSASIKTDLITVNGDIAWLMFPDLKTRVGIKEWHFNAVMTPFPMGLDFGVGTNLDWAVGPKPFAGPRYSAYEIPEYAGLPQIGFTVGDVQNTFADDAVAVRYTFKDRFVIGAGLNAGLDGVFAPSATPVSDELLAGIGAKVNFPGIISIGATYSGSFKSTGNIVYVGSELHVINNFDIDVWANLALKENSTYGARIKYDDGDFCYAPEFTMTFWDNERDRYSLYGGMVIDKKIMDTILVGVNTSWAVDLDISDTARIITGGRLNVTPHVVWNITERQQLSVAGNVMPVWWRGVENGFHWSIPVSWKVLF